MQNEVRRGVTQAKLNEDAANWFLAEIFLAAAGIGFWAKSWWVFGGVLFALLIASWIPRLAAILAVGFTLFWAAVGWEIGRSIGNLGASVVLAILGLLIAGGLHMSAIEWIQDVNAER